MPWKITAEAGEFDQAVDHFASRVVLSDDERKQIPGAARSRAFWIAGTAQLDVVQHVQDKLTKAIAEGTTLEDFKKTVRESLKTTTDTHLETVYRNATQTAYNAGRWQQMSEPSVTRFRPFWLYDAVLDGRTTPLCNKLNGTLLAASDPFWDSHTPPMHHRCFPAGTLIQTQRGNVPIESVRDGDLALTHLGRFRRVTELMRSPSPERLSQITFQSGRRLTATPGHPALTERGWVELAMLREGDRVLHVPELTAQHGVVRDSHRDESASQNSARPTEREAVRVLRDFDRQTSVGYQKIDKENFLANHQRMLEDVADGHFVQPGDKRSLCSSRRHPCLGMVRRIRDQLEAPGLSRLVLSFIGRASAAFHKTLADNGKSWMVALRSALRPMQMAGSLALGYGGGKSSTLICAPFEIAGPLRSDCIRPGAHLNSVLSEQGGSATNGVESHLAHQLAQPHATVHVEISEDFAKSVAVLLNESVFKGRFEVVASHDLTPRSSAQVYNFAVADDESYIASGIVVHNCRSSVRSLRRSEADRRGLTQKLSDEPVPAGFGLSPRVAQEWKPNPEGRSQRLLAELERKRLELARRPPPPPAPRTFGPARNQRREPDPPLRQTIRIGRYAEVELNAAQQKAHQTAQRLSRGYEARSSASHAERRTWMLWEWVRGSNRKSAALVKEAARREFGGAGVPWYRGKPYSLQPADVTRTQRDLRRIYSETQQQFARRKIRTVTLYRGVYGDDTSHRNTVESWTSSRTVAEKFARKGPNPRVLTITVPVGQVLVYHKVPGWVDGPFGEQAEYLLLW